MQKHVNLVDLVKSFPTNILLQNLASIQKRTSPVKFAHLAEKSGKGSISNLSTKVVRGARVTPAPRVSRLGPAAGSRRAGRARALGEPLGGPKPGGRALRRPLLRTFGARGRLGVRARRLRGPRCGLRAVSRAGRGAVGRAVPGARRGPRGDPLRFF